MAQQQSTITVPPGLRRVGEEPPPVNLFLVAGWWQAACRSCGSVLAEHHRQATVERRAARATCPVCA